MYTLTNCTCMSKVSCMSTVVTSLTLHVQSSLISYPKYPGKEDLLPSVCGILVYHSIVSGRKTAITVQILCMSMVVIFLFYNCTNFMYDHGCNIFKKKFIIVLHVLVQG